MMIKGSVLCSVPIVKRFKPKKMAVAHALCHVTCSWGSETTKNLKTLTPNCLFIIQPSGGYDDD